MELDEEKETSPTFFQKFGLSLILGGMSLFFIVAALILLFKTTQTSEQIRFSSDQSVATQSSHMIVADIEGAVVYPGLYEIPEGSRVEDLLVKAGGLTEDADSDWVSKTLNRASMVSDGAKFFIPNKGTASFPSDSEKKTVDSGTSTAIPISINAASEKELDTLPGVGEVTAKKIIDNRPYQRLEELLERKIIGPSVFEKIKGQITL